MKLLILILSHNDNSIEPPYNNFSHFKKMEDKMTTHYKKLGVDYRLVKHDPLLSSLYEEKGDTLFIKGIDIMVDNAVHTSLKNKIMYNFYKDYDYVCKTTLTTILNIDLIRKTILKFEETNEEILYCGPKCVFGDSFKIGGFCILMNKAAVHKLLSVEWNYNQYDDFLIGEILGENMTSFQYYANHRKWEFDMKVHNLSWLNYQGCIKFVQYRQDINNPNYEGDYLFFDIISKYYIENSPFCCYY